MSSNNFEVRPKQRNKPILVLQCPGYMWRDGAVGRHMFVTAGVVDAETMHAKALKLTTEDPEDIAVVHDHPFSEAQCNPNCVRYPGKVSVLDNDEGGQKSPGAA